MRGGCSGAVPASVMAPADTVPSFDSTVLAWHSAAYWQHGTVRPIGTIPFPWCPDTLRQPGTLRQPCTWGHGVPPPLRGGGVMPPIGGTAWCCLWAAQHSAAGFGGGMAPSIDGTIWPPDRAAQNGGGGVAPAEWRVQRTPNGALSLPGQSAGPVPARQPPGGALSGGIPPDVMRGGADAGPPGEPGRRRDSGGGMQWLPIGGMPARRGDGPGGYGACWDGAADGRHDFVPPMAGRNGAAYWQHSRAGLRSQAGRGGVTWRVAGGLGRRRGDEWGQ